MVFRTLSRLTGHEHVEDLAQEVFLRLFRAMEHFRGDAQLSTYLYRIVVNVAQDEWKRRRRERERFATTPALLEDEDTSWIESFPQDTPATDELLSQQEIWRAVEQELQQLSEAERAVLVLYHQEECSYEHIALTLKLPLGTVRTHLHRGRERLGKLVKTRLAATGRGVVPQ